MTTASICQSQEQDSPRNNLALPIGRYADESGGRVLFVTREDNAKYRLEIRAKDTSDRFVNLAAIPQVVGTQILQMEGVNDITGNKETLRVTLESNQLQVERLGVPFLEVILFKKQ
ncbi:MAG: hypothetical protein FJ395_08305 [Verrucomicrobia bacterium]|nr:hypothetical protein [Verrucomicrobiota bacterium]